MANRKQELSITSLKESFPASNRRFRTLNEGEGGAQKQSASQDAMISPPQFPPPTPSQLIASIENMVANSANVASTAGKTTPMPLQTELGDKAGKKETEKNHGTSTEKPSTKNGAKSVGIASRISTAWENMKRMLGFAPDCHNGGYRTIGSQSCTCPQYFEGQYCERILCVNGGKRMPVAAFGGEEVCKCPDPDYIRGKHCEQVHCQNGGRLLNDGSCHCVDGWYSGQFCQFYTSSWLIAIGLPLLFITFVIFCCVICRMDLCALRRHSPPSRNRQRSHGRRRPQSQGNGGGGNNRNNNRHRREQISFRQREEEMTGRQQQNPYIQQQNLLNGQQHQPQYVLRLEQIPMYNPRLYVPIDKPTEPPPPYEQAVLCPPPNQNPPNYCQQLPNQQPINLPPSNGHLNGREEERRNRTMEHDRNEVDDDYNNTNGASQQQRQFTGER